MEWARPAPREAAASSFLRLAERRQSKLRIQIEQVWRVQQGLDQQLSSDVLPQRMFSLAIAREVQLTDETLSPQGLHRARLDCRAKDATLSLSTPVEMRVRIYRAWRDRSP